MFEIVTFVENEEVEMWLKKILGSVSKWKVSPVKVVINNGMETYSDEYNEITKDHHDLDTETKHKLSQVKVIINNGLDAYGEEYNQIIKECNLGIDIVNKIYEKINKPVIIEFTDQLGKYNLLYKSSKAMLSLREHPKETKVHFANRLAENIKQVHFFK